jgi:hypothetical protein
MLIFINLCSKLRCHVVSKDFTTSKNIATVDVLLFKFEVTWLISLIHWSVVLWQSRKPNLLASSRYLSSICLWTIFLITLSNSLPVIEKRLTRSKFWGNFGSLIRVRVRLILGLAVYSQSVRLGAKPFEIHDKFFFNRTFAVMLLM